MDIATNAVLAAALLDISTTVKPLGVPLETPLQSSNVMYFHTGPDSVGSDSLAWVVIYKEAGRGVYRFNHDWGILAVMQTPDAMTGLQDPLELDRLVGEVRYSEAQCLAKFKETLRALGHTNLTSLEELPTVKGPVKYEVDGRIVPRYQFGWSDPKGRLPDWMKVVRGEVNAEKLRVEYFSLGMDFKRKPWPLTFGQTNPPTPPKPPLKVVRTELEVKDVSREYAMALIRHILPAIEEFGRKFGPPLDKPVHETDIVMGESSVRMMRGRVCASVRLKSGFQVNYGFGRVMAVFMPDAYSAKEGEVRDATQYYGPIRLTREKAVEQVRRLVLDKLALPEKPLYLDSSPTFLYAPESGATNGFSRYVFYWQKPETEQERNERIDRRMLLDITVWAEVDAGSGVIDWLSFMHPSLERPDPKIDVPMNPSSSRRN